jgi:uncharacterized protein (TIGR02466 family)
MILKPGIYTQSQLNNSVEAQDTLEDFVCFPTVINKINKLEFLESVKLVSNESLEINRKKIDQNEQYPVVMSENLDGDPRIMDFANYVAQTGWNLLSQWGYDVFKYQTYFTELWCQEHSKHSLMEQHLHPNCLIVGMYFLEVPENTSKFVIHDPRIAKISTDLPQQNVANITNSTSIIHFEPKEGDLFFAPAWLAHSFTRHASDSPIKFIHFNIAIKEVNLCQSSIAEVI